MKTKNLISDFEKNVLKLVSGTAISQVLPWLASPILTRLYSPEEFGSLTILLAILTVGNTISTGKYEVAIYLPEDDRKARAVVRLNEIVLLIISAIIAIIFLVFGGAIKKLLHAESLGIWFYLVPLVIFFMGLYTVDYSWINRLKMFTHMAASRIFRSASMTGIQLVMGFTSLKPIGLILGQFAGEIFAALYLLRLRKPIPKDERPDKAELKSLAKEYSGFPKYALPGNLINSVSNQMPVFLFSSYFSAAVVGQYGLTFRILTAPLSLLSGALLDVFRQQASADYAATGSCRPIFLSTLVKLSLLSLPVFLVIGLFGEELFEFVFGREWRVAGQYASILSILFFIRFVASPLSYVIYIAQKQKVDLIWQIALTIVTLLAIGLGIYLNNVELTLWLFSLSYSFMYLIYLYLSYAFTVNRGLHDRHS